MASDRRSMLIFRPSSSRRTFSSRVPNRVSIWGLISMLFFIQYLALPPALWMRVALCTAETPLTGHGQIFISCLEVEPAEDARPEVQATTIGVRVPLSSDES